MTLRRATRPARHALAYGALRLFTGALSLLPLPWARALGSATGYALSLFLPSARRRAGSAHLADLARRFIEVARGATHLIDVPPDLVSELRQGGLVLTAHYGNWELLGAALASAGVDVHSIAARQGKGPLFRWLATRRATFGVTVHPPGGGAKTALTRLKTGKPTALLFDLETREKSREIPFLNRPTRFSRTAERLLSTTHARALRAWTVLQPDGRYKVEWAVLGPDPLTEAAAALERAIQADPTQWVWLTDRWPPDNRDTKTPSPDFGVEGRGPSRPPERSEDGWEIPEGDPKPKGARPTQIHHR